jgi:hypothetical protein
MNPTRIPKEVLLPDWAYQGISGTRYWHWMFCDKWANIHQHDLEVIWSRNSLWIGVQYNTYIKWPVILMEPSASALSCHHCNHSVLLLVSDTMAKFSCTYTLLRMYSNIYKWGICQNACSIWLLWWKWWDFCRNIRASVLWMVANTTANSTWPSVHECCLFLLVIILTLQGIITLWCSKVHVK